MKENYFTWTNIAVKSRKMLAMLKKQAECHTIDIKCSRPALLIIDMQKYFLDRRSHAFIPSAPPIVPNIKKLINRFLKVGLPTIFTQHINNKKNAGMLSEWWNDLITEKSPFSEIIPELSSASAKVIRKSQYDAFYNTGLETYLKRKNVDTVIITGVMAHLCCETTARSAFTRGYKVFFAIDGTATQNSNFHYATLLNLAHGFAIPVLTNELIRNLKVQHA